jgi:hypothetical protein
VARAERHASPPKYCSPDGPLPSLAINLEGSRLSACAIFITTLREIIKSYIDYFSLIIVANHCLLPVVQIQKAQTVHSMIQRTFSCSRLLYTYTSACWNCYSEGGVDTFERLLESKESEMLTRARCGGRRRLVSRLSSKERGEKEKTKRQCQRIIPKMATHVIAKQ